MRKAVAIPYAIALILGVIGVAVLGYWLISQSSKTTTVGTSAECQGKIFSFCIQWQTSGLKGSEWKNWGSCSQLIDDGKEADECAKLGIKK